MSPSRLPIVWVAVLQSLGLALLLWALAGGQLSLLLALLPAALLVWLPVLLVRPAAAESAGAVDALQISQLSRELSQTTTQNALSAAEVAYAVKQLGERLRSQLQAADSIVGNAQNMIATEEQTSLLSQQTAGAALQVRQSSDRIAPDSHQCVRRVARQIDQGQDKYPQVRQDQPQVVAGAAHHRVQRIAQRVHRLTCILAAGLERKGISRVNTQFFDTLTLDVGGAQTAIIESAQAAQINLRILGRGRVGLSLDETCDESTVAKLFDVLLGADVPAGLRETAVVRNVTPVRASGDRLELSLEMTTGLAGLNRMLGDNGVIAPTARVVAASACNPSMQTPQVSGCGESGRSTADDVAVKFPRALRG